MRAQPSLTISKGVILSGLLLTLCTVIALLDINSPLFLLGWTLHVLFQIILVWFSVRVFWNLGSGCGAIRTGSRAFAALTLAVIVVIGLLPVTARDALIYHLAVPKMWLEAGRISELKWHEWSYFPLLMSTGYAGFLRLGLTALLAPYHASFLLITAAITASFFEERYQQKLSALLVFIVFLTTPILFRLATIPLVDLTFMTFLSAAIVFLSGALTTRTCLMAGLAIGLSMSTKYNPMAGILLVFVFVFLNTSNGTAKSRAVRCVQIILWSLIPFIPWGFRNYAWTGNPFFPLLSAGHLASSFTGEILPVSYRSLIYNESLLDFILIPFRLLVTGQDDNPRLFDGVLSPFFLLAIIPIFSARYRHDFWVRLSSLYVALYLLIAMLTYFIMARYMTPLLLPLAILSVLGWMSLFCSVSKTGKWVALIFLAIHLCFFLDYAASAWKRVSPLPYLSGYEDREQYLSRQLSEYSMIQFVNANIPRRDQFYLLMTGNRYFYYKGQPRGGYLSADPVIEMIEKSDSPQSLTKAFNEAGFSWLVFHKRRTQEILQQSLSPEKQPLWTAFLAGWTTTVYEDPFFRIVRIKPAQGTVQ